MDMKLIDDGAKTGDLVLLWRPPPTFGMWQQYVLARWVEKTRCGQDVQAWCWSDDVDMNDHEAFLDHVDESPTWEERDNFTCYAPIPYPVWKGCDEGASPYPPKPNRGV